MTVARRQGAAENCPARHPLKQRPRGDEARREDRRLVSPLLDDSRAATRLGVKSASDASVPPAHGGRVTRREGALVLPHEGRPHYETERENGQRRFPSDDGDEIHHNSRRNFSSPSPLKFRNGAIDAYPSCGRGSSGRS